MSQTSSTTEKHSHTVKESAALLGVGTRTIREWITGGRLTAYNFGAGAARPVYRVLASDLAAFVASRRVKPQDETGEEA